MGSLLTEIAASLKTHLEAGQYSFASYELAIERKVIPYFERAELGSLKRIVVTPGTSNQLLVARTNLTIPYRQQYNLTEDINIQAAVDYNDLETTDGLAVLADEVMTQASSHQPGIVGQVQVTMIGVKYEPVLVVEDLIQYRIFNSRMVAEYVVIP